MNIDQLLADLDEEHAEKIEIMENIHAADRSDDALIRRARELLTFWKTHQ